MHIYNIRSRSLEWQHNLQKMLLKLDGIKRLPETRPGEKHLHVGCGKNVFQGFTNIDKYYQHPDILNIDMFQLSFENIATIYSSHSLEHLPIRQAKMCLNNWAKSLKSGGMLYLAIPDLEEIMLILTDPNVEEDKKEYWYMYTLFGYQADCSDLGNAYRLEIPVDLGQFHTCGWSKKMIERDLVKAGFKIVELYNYDGYATPSIWIEATV